MVVMEEEWVFEIEDLLQSVRDNHARFDRRLADYFSALI